MTMKIDIHGASDVLKPVRILKTAAVAHASLGHGRLIPILVLDTKARPEIMDLILLHEGLPPGDVDCMWGRPAKAPRDTICLFLQFKRPAQAVIVLQFHIVDQGNIVDQILRQRSVVLQGSFNGDQVEVPPGKHSVLAEVPDTGFKSKWDAMLQKHLSKDFRRRGLSAKQSRHAAIEAIREWRRFSDFRAQDPPKI